MKSVSLDAEVARKIERMASAENRTTSNFIETVLLSAMKTQKNSVGNEGKGEGQ